MLEEVEEAPPAGSEAGWARALRGIENVAMGVVSLALFAIMVVTVVDVVRRYAFNAPLTWAYDVSGQYLMVAAFFLALSYTLRVDGHMKVDLLLVRVTSPLARDALVAVGDVLALVFFIALLVVSTQSTWTAWANAETLPGALPLPVWLSRMFVPLGTLILVLRLTYRVALFGLRRRV
ncbi:MAG: TRAP transporter small permease subunit [Variovorax sp.]